MNRRSVVAGAVAGAATLAVREVEAQEKIMVSEQREFIVRGIHEAEEGKISVNLAEVGAPSYWSAPISGRTHGEMTLVVPENQAASWTLYKTVTVTVSD